MSTQSEMLQAMIGQFQAQQAQQAQPAPLFTPPGIENDLQQLTEEFGALSARHDAMVGEMLTRTNSLEKEISQLTQAVQLLFGALQNGAGSQPQAGTFRNVAEPIPAATSARLQTPAPAASSKPAASAKGTAGDNPHGYTGHCQATVDAATGSVCGEWCKYAVKLCPAHVHLHPDPTVRETAYARVAKKDGSEQSAQQQAGVKGGSVALHPASVTMTPAQFAYLQAQQAQQRRNEEPPAAAPVTQAPVPPVTPAGNGVTLEEMFAQFIASQQQAQQTLPLTLPKRQRAEHDVPNCDCGICAKVREKEMIPHPASYIAKHPERGVHNQIIARNAQQQAQQAQQPPAAITPFPKSQERKCPICNVTHRHDDGKGMNLCPVHDAEFKKNVSLLKP